MIAPGKRNEKLFDLTTLSESLAAFKTALDSIRSAYTINKEENVLVTHPVTSTSKASIGFATFLCEIGGSFLSKRGKSLAWVEQSNPLPLALQFKPVGIERPRRMVSCWWMNAEQSNS
jgi:hypothetical protein